MTFLIRKPITGSDQPIFQSLLPEKLNAKSAKKEIEGSERKHYHCFAADPPDAFALPVGCCRATKSVQDLGLSAP